MEENKNAYSEVIEILKLIDDEKKLEALPIEMLEVLKLKANPEYKPQISKEISLEEQNLQPETFSILSWIATKYWNEDTEDISSIEQEKSENENIKQIDENNNEIKDENLNEKIDDNSNTSIDEKITETKYEEFNSILPIAYKDLKWYQRIKVKIIAIFNKIFKRNNIEKETNHLEEGNTL